MKRIGLFFVLIGLSALTCGAGEMTTAKEVFTRFKNRYKGEDSIMDMRLILINKRNERRHINLLRYRKRAEGLVSSIFFFVGPADVRGTATLTSERPEKDDLQRIYLHSLRKHRRIASSDKGKSWLGTDLQYEDIQEKKPDDYNYSELSTDQVDGQECYHFNMMPKKRSTSAYGRLEYWVQKDNDELVQGRYYDRKDRCIKVMKMGHFVKTFGSKGTRTINSATWMTMYNLKDKHRTILVTDRVSYNIGLPDRVFTPRFIETLPKPFEGGVVHKSRLEDCMFDPGIVRSPAGAGGHAKSTASKTSTGRAGA